MKVMAGLDPAIQLAPNAAFWIAASRAAMTIICDGQVRWANQAACGMSVRWSSAAAISALV